MIVIGVFDCQQASHSVNIIYQEFMHKLSVYKVAMCYLDKDLSLPVGRATTASFPDSVL